MKKIKYLFLLLLTILVLPLGVFAEEGEAIEIQPRDGEVSNEVVVYFFRGEGCSHCAEAEEWFSSIEEEYGSKYEIVDYETWYNTDNQELMTKVAKARGEEDSATGVPYIIVGDHSWIGFDQSYTTEIIDAINQEYEKEVADRYDVMNYLDTVPEDKEEKSTGSDILALVLILLVAGGAGYGIYFARKQNQ